jgi:hypothetical protein
MPNMSKWSKVPKRYTGNYPEVEFDFHGLGDNGVSIVVDGYTVKPKHGVKQCLWFVYSLMAQFSASALYDAAKNDPDVRMYLRRIVSICNSVLDVD